MVRVIIKGGVWKNTEDEVLKAAVMKYGKNQWARISSLLTRKTPKQCKARWFEWLDPAVKKMDWSRDEDEKLLHMAKLMPTQWRTIAPVVGRTASQCLERYQKLLDEAELGEQGPTSDDIRKLRPGEIDPNPESKPARPDPVDMDEDEKEMLSEARARLANTMGKKAKRKAREKQLADARRISNLQKKREMKNAGIEEKERKAIKGMNYSKDIPFHHPQPSGFWDTNKERIREAGEKRDLSNALVEQLEGKRRLEIEIEEKKKDFKKQKLRKENPELDLINEHKSIEDEFQVTARKRYILDNRHRLVLPAPQVTEEDLQEIVKMGISGQTAQQMISTGQETPANFVEQHEFAVPLATRTPKISTSGHDGSDVLKSMARNLKAMSQSQTPLLGEDLPLEGQVEFAPTPQRFIAQTPNILGSKTPAGTPRHRDSMGINTPLPNSFNDTPQRSGPAAAKQLSSLFAQLPKPKNEFEIVVPELHDSEYTVSQPVLDSEIIAQLNEENQRKLEEREFKLRSRAAQKDLPRPLVTTAMLKELEMGDDEITKLINHEKARLIYRDAKQFPMPEQDSLERIERFEKPEIGIDGLDKAAELIEKELNGTDLRLPDEFPLLFKDFNIELKTAKILRNQNLSVSQLKDYHALYLKTMSHDAAVSQRLEKKLNTKLGGYMMRRKGLITTFNATLNKKNDLDRDLEAFSGLQREEEAFIRDRVYYESKELQRLAMIEQDLQDRFRQLSYERDELNR